MPPKAKEKAPPPVFEPPKEFEITMTIDEVGNFDYEKSKYMFEVSYFDRLLVNEIGGIFEPCTCASLDNLGFEWKLTMVAGLEYVLEMSSVPLLVYVYKSKEVSEGGETTATFDKIGYACVDLTDLIKTNSEVSKLQTFQFLNKEFLGMRTWPNVPFFKYRLTTNEPILTPEESSSCNLIKVTFECIFNPPETLFEPEVKVQAAVALPKKTETYLNVTTRIGKVISAKKMPQKSVLTTMKDIDCPAALTNFAVHEVKKDCPKQAEFFVVPKELIDENTQIISFHETYKTLIHNDALKKFVTQKRMGIEVFIDATDPTKKMHTIGLLDITSFEHVGVTKVRGLMPLQSFDIDILKTCGHDQQIFGEKGPPKKDAKKPPPPKPVKGAPPPVPEEPKSPYLADSEGYSTSLLVTVELADAIIKRKEDFMDLTLMTLINTPHVRQSTVTNEKDLEAVFKMRIASCLSQRENKCYLNPDDYNVVKSMTEACAAVIFQKFNFKKAIDDDEFRDTLEEAYIYAINKVKDVVSGQDHTSENACAKLSSFRVQCAMECAELDLKESSIDFYVMNIIDNPNSTKSYLDYAVQHLFNRDMHMALECCYEAIKLNANSPSSFLLQAYVAFVYNDTIGAENILLKLTKESPNYMEAWMALLVIYFQDERKLHIEFALESLEKAAKHPITTMLHKRKEVVWKPRINKVYGPLIAAIRFIAWGCLNFAELAFSWLMNKFGGESAEYTYHMALIDYYRKKYISALQRLGKINPICISDRLDILKLRIHCLLGLNSVEAVFELRDIHQLRAGNCFDKRTNLIYLKIGQKYLQKNKKKTAIFYFKQCCRSYGTYGSYFLLGQTLMKGGDFDNAIASLELAHRLNPFNGEIFAYLAIIYFRCELLPQCKMCLQEAKKEKLNKKLSQELDYINDILIKQQQPKCDDLTDTI